MNGFVAFLRSFGAGRIAAMLAVALALAGFFAFTIVRFTSPQMVPLFSDLSLQDSSAVVKELDQQNVPYEIRQDGAGVLVPKDQVAKLRMKLAEKSLPSGGGVGWEIFDKGDGFSATSFVQNVNHLRALEGELARSIRSLNRVESARVHLVIPEKPLFTRDAPTPSASIVIRARGELEGGEIRAIRHLAASAVQGLKPDKVSLVDESGRLLADGAGAEDGSAASADERTVVLERRLRERVEAILGRIVGADRARVEVRAEMDNVKSTVTADTFDPESRVVRSTQTREESAQTNETEQSVSVGNQLPNAQNGQAPGTPQTKDASNKTEEVVNYEISRTTRTDVQDAGRLKRLSVAVLVDGVYSRAANGDVAYAARSQEELDRIGALVRAGIGFDAARGDAVEVVNLRFADLPGVASAAAAEPGLFDLTREDMMRWAELGVLALLTLLVLFVVVRPLLRKALAPERYVLPALVAPGGELAALPMSGAAALGGPVGTDMSSGDAGAARKIAAAEIAGRVQADSVQRIGELVRNNPNETVSILRQWMQEPA